MTAEKIICLRKSEITFEKKISLYLYQFVIEKLMEHDVWHPPV